MNSKQTEDLLASLRHLREQRDRFNRRIYTVEQMLARANVGKYNNGTISQTKAVKINVRAYVRDAYRIIRTKRYNGA